jgi:hypothetical protein
MGQASIDDIVSNAGPAAATPPPAATAAPVSGTAHVDDIVSNQGPARAAPADNSSTLSKVGDWAKGTAEGATESMGETIQSLPWIGKKILSPEAMQAEREYFKPGSPAEKVGQTTGDIAEPVLEFVLGDEALKGVALAEKLGIASKIADIAKTSPYIGKILQHGVNAARMGTVGAAEAKAKGASNTDALKAGVVAGIGGEAISAAADAVPNALQSVFKYKFKNPFTKLASQFATPEAAGEAVSQPIAQAGVKSAAPTVNPSFRSGIDVTTPFTEAKGFYKIVDDAAKTDFKVLYEKLDAAQDAARISAPGSPEEAAAQRNIKLTEDSITEHKAIAAKSGVPDVDKHLAAADAKYAETQANKDLNSKFFGSQSVIKGNVAHGIPEHIDVDNAISVLENLDKPNKFGISRLQQTSLGKSGAFKLKQALYDAQKAGKTSMDTRTLRNTILKFGIPGIASALGLGYELTK